MATVIPSGHNDNRSASKPIQSGEALKLDPQCVAAAMRHHRQSILHLWKASDISSDVLHGAMADIAATHFMLGEIMKSYLRAS